MRGLGVLKEKPSFYRQNESNFTEDIVVLKRDLEHRDAQISMLKYDLEKIREQKYNIHLSVDTLEYTSKGLQKIIEARLVNKARLGLGYKYVVPPNRGTFVPPGIDLSHTGLDEFKEKEFPAYGPKTTESPIVNQTEDSFQSVSDNSLVNEFVPEVKSEVKVEMSSVPKVVKQENEKPIRNTVKYAEMYRSTPRGNQRNWNNLKSQQLGTDFVMQNKTCFVCGSFDHFAAYCNHNSSKKVDSRDTRVSWNRQARVNNNFAKETHSNAKMIPRAIMLKHGTKPLSTARPNKIVSPKKTVSSTWLYSCSLFTIQSHTKSSKY
jgi:hypothetical protein